MKQETNASINGTYVVKLSENNKRGPDVDLQTTNGAFDVTIYLNGTLPRPAEFVTNNTNGRGTITIASRDMPINIQSRGTNGRVLVSLPRDFDGLISLRSVNGAKALSEQLSDGAVVYPNEEGGDSKTITYLIRPKKSGGETVLGDTKDIRGDVSLKQPAAEAPVESDEWRTAEPGPDRVFISTTNGGAYAQYVGEVREKPAQAESRCIVM